MCRGIGESVCWPARKPLHFIADNKKLRAVPDCCHVSFLREDPLTAKQPTDGASATAGCGPLMMVGTLDAVASLVAERVLRSGPDVMGVGAEAPRGWPGEAGFRVHRDRRGVGAAVRDLRPQCLVNFCGEPVARSGRLALANTAMRAAASASVPLLIHWGSAAAYPQPLCNGRPWLETDALDELAGANDATAIDYAVREFARVHARTKVYVFRAAATVGPRSSGIVEDLLRTPLVSRLRRDPMIQFLHEDDAVDVLWRAVQEGHGGTYNVAADGLLRLSEVCRAVARPSAMLPAALAWGLACVPWLLRRAPSPARQLRLSSGLPILDNTRLKTHLGMRPRYTGRAALAAARDSILGALPKVGAADSRPVEDA